MNRTWILAFAVVLASACGDSRKTTDSTLARDLALAGQPTGAIPELRDTALSPKPTKAPSTKRPAAPRAEAPVPSSDAPPVTAPAPVPAPAPFRGLAAGTVLDLHTRAAVCTTNLPGDKITATVTTNVVGENGAMIPAGTVVVLEVVEVVPGDKPENARVVLRVRSVMVSDQPIDAPSNVAIVSELERHQLPRDRGSDRRKVIGGAVAGAIVGQIIGKDTRSTVTGAAVGAAAGAVAAGASAKFDACLPAGGSLRATTTQPVPISG